MMTKKEHIDYWVITSQEDYKAFTSLLKDEHFLHALFLGHLILEKLIKAHWVKDNELNIPPKTHSLLKLSAQTNLHFNQEELKFLAKFNEFQLEGRYPDYQLKIYQSLNRNVVKDILIQFENIRKCLIENLQ